MCDAQKNEFSMHLTNECTSTGFVKVKHIEGKKNLSDLFTKEDRDISHFLEVRNLLLTPKPGSMIGSPLIAPVVIPDAIRAPGG